MDPDRRKILTMGGTMTDQLIPDDAQAYDAWLRTRANTEKPHVIDERLILERLGIPRQTLKDRRTQFQEGTDWQKTGRGVIWTAEAASRLIASFAPPDPPAPPEAQPAEKMARRMVLTVANPNLPNHTLLAAVAPGDDARDRSKWILVRIRPGLGRRFTVAMQLLAEQVPGVRLWRFLGPPDAPEGSPVRYPKFRGRWGLPGEKAAGGNTETP